MVNLVNIGSILTTSMTLLRPVENWNSPSSSESFKFRERWSSPRSKLLIRKLIVIKIRVFVRENKGREKFERGLVGSFFFKLIYLFWENERWDKIILDNDKSWVNEELWS